MTVTNGVSATEAARLKQGSVWRAPAPWTVLMGNVVCVFRAGTVGPVELRPLPFGQGGALKREAPPARAAVRKGGVVHIIT